MLFAVSPRALRLLLPFLLLVFSPCGPVRGDTEESPRAADPLRIVLVVVDDLGWRDLGCQGSETYRTPHLDRLAASGLRFTSAYAASGVCSPSRAAILTGRAPARLLLTQWLPAGRWDRRRHRKQEGRFLSALPLEEVTIAEILREAGYATAIIGKWHLGSLPYHYPRHQGFDTNIGGHDFGAPGSYFHPFEGSWKIPSTGQVLHKPGPVEGKPGDYLVDRLAEEAEGWIRAHAKRPFFLLLSHYAVHGPLQGKPEKVARYEEIPEERRQGDPRYAAMIESVDESVGRVMRTLDELEIADETLLVVTSDNGGWARATRNEPLAGSKGSLLEGGIRVPALVRWPGRIEPGSVCDVPVTGMDWMPTFLEAAGVSPPAGLEFDGESLLPLFEGEEKLERETLYWHYPHYNRHPHSFPASAIRAGRWKLIENLETGEIRLHDLREDLGETRDLSSDRPEIRRDLHEKLRVWRETVGAEPLRANPGFDSSR